MLRQLGMSPTVLVHEHSDIDLFQNDPSSVIKHRGSKVWENLLSRVKEAAISLEQ